MTKSKILILATAASAGLSAPAPLRSQIQPVVFEYAVKYVCGTGTSMKSAPAVPGAYLTAINVHNPGKDIDFTYKSALSLPLQGGSYTPWKPLVLKYDHALDIRCRDIGDQLTAAGINFGTGFHTGFLVIRAHSELDVVAVYTAAPVVGNAVPQVSSIQVDRIPYRKAPFQ